MCGVGNAVFVCAERGYRVDVFQYEEGIGGGVDLAGGNLSRCSSFGYVSFVWFPLKGTFELLTTYIGGIPYPISFWRLQPTLGFGWATRIISLIVLAAQLVSLALLRARTSLIEP